MGRVSHHPQALERVLIDIESYFLSLLLQVFISFASFNFFCFLSLL